ALNTQLNDDSPPADVDAGAPSTKPLAAWIPHLSSPGDSLSSSLSDLVTKFDGSYPPAAETTSTSSVCQLPHSASTTADHVLGAASRRRKRAGRRNIEQVDAKIGQVVSNFREVIPCRGRDIDVFRFRLARFTDVHAWCMYLVGNSSSGRADGKA